MLTNRFLAAAVTAMTASAALGAAGPIAHWRFNETSGGIASDSAGNFPGTLLGSASWSPGSGIAGGAISLARTTNDRVRIGDVLPLVGPARFTIVAWVRLPTATVPEQLFLGRHRSGITAGWFLASNVSGGSYGAPGKAWFYAGHAPGPEPISTTSLNDNAWHQVVVTRDPSTIRIYVDGAPAEQTKTPIGIGGTAAPLMIGAIVVGANEVGYLDGLIDEIQIYNRVLSDADINFLFANPASTVAARCQADLTHTAAPGSTGYGLPDCVLNSEDFFYYLAQYGAGNLVACDLTTTAVPGSAGYGVPNGVLNSEDFFYYLAQYGAGC